MAELDSFFITSIFIFLLSFYSLLFFIKLKKRYNFNRFFTVIIWNILSSLFLVILIFIIGESYYRFFVDTTDSFALNKISQRWSKNHVRLNNFNIRDDKTYHVKIKKGKRRITIIGDSFSSGHGIKNINNRFGNLLRKQFPNTEIHIIAINGLNSKSELDNLFTMKERGYEFDLILLAYCLNDIDYLVKESVEIDSRIKSFNKGRSFIEKNSYFINTLSFRYFAYQDPDFMSYSNFVLNGYQNDKLWNEHKEKLKEIKLFTEEIKKTFIVVTFPFLQEQIENYSFKEAHKKINDFWYSENVPHLDLLNTFKPYLGNKLVVNQYDAHPNEFANKLAVEAIVDFFKQKKSK